MIEIVESSDQNPICPHCEKELTKIFASQTKSVLGVRFVYFCSHCKKVLGVSHRKGIWSG